MNKKGLGKGLAAPIGEKESLVNDINKTNDVSIQNLRQRMIPNRVSAPQ